MSVIDSLRTGEPAGRARPQAARVEEPPTGRALWPTFMRRTLDEEAVRRSPVPAPRRAAEPG